MKLAIAAIIALTLTAPVTAKADRFDDFTFVCNQKRYAIVDTYGEAVAKLCEATEGYNDDWVAATRENASLRASLEAAQDQATEVAAHTQKQLRQLRRNLFLTRERCSGRR